MLEAEFLQRRFLNFGNLDLQHHLLLGSYLDHVDYIVVALHMASGKIAGLRGGAVRAGLAG